MSYDPDKAAQILELIAEQGLGLKGACDRLQMPRRTARNWAARIPEFAAGLAQARRESYEHWADEMLEIADAMEKCQSVPEVMAARVRLDTRKWLLAKLNPQKYGDKVELTGRDGAALIPMTSPEAAIPRLLQVLAVLLPGTGNSELFQLATTMVRKLQQADDPDTTQPVKVLTNGTSEEH